MYTRAEAPALAGRRVRPTAMSGASPRASAARIRQPSALCAVAGLRLGEASAVQVGEADFLRRSLAVRRQVQRAGRDAAEIRLPKYGSERTVYRHAQATTTLNTYTHLRPTAEDGTRLARTTCGLNEERTAPTC